MATDVAHAVDAVRRFNRAYTRQIGVLQEHLLESPFSLAEARVLYEVANRAGVTARALCDELGLDPGYLSRILARFVRDGLVSRRASERDGRERLLALTARGRQAFVRLDAASRDQIAALLRPLSSDDRRQLVHAAERIRKLLGMGPAEAPAAAARWTLRPPRPGDMGWVVQRHGVLYAREYGWDARFEALVAEIVARFVQRLDAERERCWIAEKDGQPVGCIFCVRKSKTVAQLRMLLVEPEARGRGIGRRLVRECVSFAKAKGYRKMILWTNDVLHAARHLYVEAGFRLVREEPHHSFGHDLVGQTWELDLSAPAPPAVRKP
jgi:DNA-binding MarR family transcriptional regulator/N-acetylglutamate synthase-like GNAT family acetyltransferase